MSAGEIGMFVLNFVAFIFMCGLCIAAYYGLETYLEERKEAKREPEEPSPSKEAQAVAAAADLAGQQAAAKVRAYLAFEEELKQKRREQWEQQ